MNVLVVVQAFFPSKTDIRDGMFIRELNDIYVIGKFDAMAVISNDSSPKNGAFQFARTTFRFPKKFGEDFDIIEELRDMYCDEFNKNSFTILYYSDVQITSTVGRSKSLRNICFMRMYELDNASDGFVRVDCEDDDMDYSSLWSKISHYNAHLIVGKKRKRNRDSSKSAGARLTRNRKQKDC